MIFAVILLTIPVLAADENKPLPQDAQIKLLKGQRQAQRIQLQMADLQRQYDQAVKDLKAVQAEMESDCAAAAKEANVDLSKYTCDLDKLAFVPRPEKKEAPEKKQP
jgi:hypothetical protein